MTTQPEPTVADNPDRTRYEISSAGEVNGFSDYRPEPSRITLVHTEVDPALTGRGLGNALVRGALDDIRRRGMSVVPVCPFVVDYIANHQEYADLVDDSSQ